ncbi:biotin--[acetyl-CoA-carboxylase] ligase [Polaribacter pacificus]|uniref:Biotin--[acetyl-CoA-carboxylase] ligase n=1 Tax=Polaribacter pacificus TaxID=1775173 RepID=A0A917HU59_9FLAO|nr:biotin--[acetyl-CoA-carboxylase] ligase [Polaribacter pacificus]GGG89306.1 biotin--[acetyl-CoA-carboxylase] ligase [Polaribacter pacificus]
MNLIKLDAIDSTNSFLKELAQKSNLTNYTVVVANYQKKGKGQMGSQWDSKPGENLLCSVYVEFNDFLATEQVLLNYAVSIAVYNVLIDYEVPKLSIKWPNDILSLNHKISGILIEPVMQQGRIISAVIGIGINVNQMDFSTSKKQITSLKFLKGIDFNLDELLQSLIEELKIQIAYITNTKSNVLKKRYLDVLYKHNVPSMFMDQQLQTRFMGKIVGVASTGKIQIQLEDETIKEFGVKEVAFV